MITAIQLMNYRSHERTKVELAPFNLFLGPMGAGKTTMLHAASLLLCGQNPLVNAKSEGLRREIHLGATDFQIALKLDSGHVIDQKVGAKTNSIGVDGAYRDVRQQRGAITALLGTVNTDCIQALLDPSPFFERDEKVQRAVLMQLMASKEVDAPALVKSFGLAEVFTSPGQIDQLVKEIKEGKVRDLNREIDVLQKQIPEEAQFSVERIKSVRENIKTLSAARDAALRKQGAVEEWEKTLAALNGRRAAFTTDADGLQKQFDAFTASKRDAEGAIAKLREEYQRKAGAINESKEKLASLVASKAGTQQTLTIVTTMGKKCGVYDAFECPLKDADKKKMGKHLEGQLEEYQGSHDVISKATDALAAELKGVESKASELKKSIAAADVKILSLDETIREQIQVLEAIEKHKATPPATGNWPKELAEASERLAAAEIDLAALDGAKQSNERRAIQVAEVVSKQTQAASLLEAVKELAAMKDSMLESSSAGFVTIMGDLLREFGIKRVEYSSDPFGFVCDGLMPDQMSGGQKVLVEAALRLAAAKTSGLGIMAIDNTNMTGEGPRNKLAKLLMGSGVQVIVCSTTDVRPQIPKGSMNGSGKIFWFQNSAPPCGPSTVEELGV